MNEFDQRKEHLVRAAAMLKKQKEEEKKEDNSVAADGPKEEEAVDLTQVEIEMKEEGAGGKNQDARPRNRIRSFYHVSQK